MNSVTKYCYSDDGERAYAPHCDSSVLHAPGECEFCDKYTDWQAYRETARINFTGHNDEHKAPCPSVYLRGGRDPGEWPGNRPEGYGETFKTMYKSWFGLT